MVDADGEAIDYAGRIEPFDIRVAAAEWRIVLARLERCRQQALGGATRLLARGVRKSFACVLLPEGYALVAQLVPHCFNVSSRALSEAIREI